MYFITCIQRIPSDTDFGGDSRTFGYYNNLDDAVIALKENRLDMHEYLYNYAIIEKIWPGIHANAVSVGRYKYAEATNSFELIEVGKLRFTNFALG